MKTRNNRPILPHFFLLAYAVICVLALIWPGYAWLGNRIEPFVFGIPFSFAWVVGWILLTFLVLCVYHAATEGRRMNP